MMRDSVQGADAGPSAALSAMADSRATLSMRFDSAGPRAIAVCARVGTEGVFRFAGARGRSIAGAAQSKPFAI